MSVFPIISLTALVSTGLVLWIDRAFLRKGFPTLGMVVVGMYVLTYGFGWLLWRTDPRSLFGDFSLSTVNALNQLGYLFSVGLFSLAAGYVFTRYFFSFIIFPQYRTPRKSFSQTAADLFLYC